MSLGDHIASLGGIWVPPTTIKSYFFSADPMFNEIQVYTVVKGKIIDSLRVTGDKPIITISHRGQSRTSTETPLCPAHRCKPRTAAVEKLTRGSPKLLNLGEVAQKAFAPLEVDHRCARMKSFADCLLSF
jgi:hypothetical protein